MSQSENNASFFSKAKEMHDAFQQEMTKNTSKKTETSVGGGMVKAVMNGRQELLSLNIDKEVLDPEKAEMLEDLIKAAVNEAVRKTEAETSQTIQKAMFEKLSQNIP